MICNYLVQFTDGTEEIVKDVVGITLEPCFIIFVRLGRKDKGYDKDFINCITVETASNYGEWLLNEFKGDNGND